ncbi:MBL fold metallo-hydrolase [Brevibacillus migulae]|uniref:MBL fold metallo-hydrolase n=1 Tax=Brevibacillus migulae TaxID=1644114 RepID=UPI00106E1835|nr:MBL fold metallo-hydrolase [Brevibacillus migulae]
MKIANGVEMIQVEVEGVGRRDVLNPVLMWDENAAVLVDAGMPGTWPQIRQAMSDLGVAVSHLKAVIVTHQDFDHIGSLPEILRDLDGRVEVYAHELDKPYIEGKLPLLKTNPEQMSKVLAFLPEEERRKALQMFANPPKANVDRVVTDGEVLPMAGGVRVIHTPGHTSGHISLYVEQSKTLIAGDAMICVDGRLRGPVSQTTPDMETAMRSLQRFLELEVDAVICYHGGVCDQHAKEQIRELADSSF